MIQLPMSNTMLSLPRSLLVNQNYHLQFLPLKQWNRRCLALPSIANLPLVLRGHPLNPQSALPLVHILLAHLHKLKCFSTF